jgi:hypothetical protein
MDRLTQFNDLPLVPAIIAKQVQAFCRGFVKGVRTNVYRHNLYGHSTSTTQPPADGDRWCVLVASSRSAGVASLLRCSQDGFVPAC